jgi:multidrug efflux system membrane fusion protein
MPSSSVESTDAFSHETPALPEHASPSSTGLPNDGAQHPAPRKSSWLRIVILILLIGGAIGFVTYRIVTNKPAAAPGAGGRRGGGANAIIPVSFDVVQKRTIPISLTALGTVTAYNTVTLKSRVDGQIIKVNFQEGQHVRQGQSLIEIDPKPYQATLSVAQGNLARDQANAALAQVQAARYNQLYAAGVVSKESNQTQESTAGQAVGTLAADRAAIQQAQVNLNYTHITSPIAGIVGLRQVDAGNIVTAASASGLVVITQVQPIAVIFTLPEDSIPAVFDHMRSGKKLVAEAWDRSNTVKIASGSLLTVDNQIDTTTGTAKLKAVFTNADSSLYPNQFVNIHLVLENRVNSVVIPAAAIQTGNNGSFVYVIDRTQPQTAGALGGAPGAANGGAKGAGANGAAAGAAPAAGSGGGNTGAATQGAGGANNAPAGGADATASGAPAAGGAGGQGGGRRGGGAAGGGGPQTNYPVKVVNVVIDSTQGTDVIIKSGLQPGQQVVTDGQEKLQDKSRVIPHPSADMVAARQLKAAGGAPAPPSNPDAGAFSNGHNSDLDPAAGATGGHHGQHGNGDAGAGSAGGHHKGANGDAANPSGPDAGAAGAGGHHHHPAGAAAQ